ncbi:MAG: bifunctional hydroxymethylpyrimidine kinase/phosphomethylpyrimidine kinase [Desulfovibrio sp.]|nr:bifunctional hydroxymethylpyrimidine kinase/phosphomethylpyrimidine kinase [Desulfovibrio sp.]
MQTPPVVLTIAGSDSGGGAGIQADLKTIAALGGFGTCAITALTAQNGATVTGIFPVDPAFVAEQIATNEAGFSIKAAKTGMLFAEPIIKTVAKSLANKTYPLVVDPVCMSQSGVKLLEDAAISALRTHILPLADLLTPNLPEAQLLADREIKTEEDLVLAGKRLLTMVSGCVLIKGGHNLGEKTVCDTLFLKDTPPISLPQSRIFTENTHGTGCTLSAAIATNLAKGHTMLSSIQLAQHYLHQALMTSYTPGIGAGPVNHLFRLV